VDCENTRHRLLSLFTWFWINCSINFKLWLGETNLTKDDFWESIDCESFMGNCYMICEDDWWCNYVTTLCCVILMLLVIVYVLIGDELLMIAYIHVLVMVRWLLFVWTYAFVVESYVHAFMTDGGGFYIQLRWVRCFCCIEGDDLKVIWYHMHLDESRIIA